ncbi:MAG TPA: hypothetical protein PKU77_13025 [Ferruginibacter sp.]|nr:hypothetical protein [Ferruginibacter sp.]
MRSFIFSTIFLLISAVSIGQHSHFLYLQSDNKQTFYIKIGDKLFSSSLSGYIIIPKLSQGVYELNIGFPNNEWPLQTVSVEINGKDQGFLLKNFDGKGWGLFNIQTMAVLMAGNKASNNTAPVVTSNDEFSNTLAKVVNTPSIKQIKKEDIKNEKIQASNIEKKVDSINIVTESIVNITPATVKNEQKNNSIKKISEAADQVAHVYSYQVSHATGMDTVDVVVLKNATNIESNFKKSNDQPIQNTQSGSNEVRSSENYNKSVEPKFIDIELPKYKQEQELSKEIENAPKPISIDKQNLNIPNSDCKSIATDNDFLKTRKKMSAQKSDEDMVDIARKLFKQKCYSTEQVKNLSVLFLKDQGKYSFFDAVYPFVHDSNEFIHLEALLTDEYYLTRFRTMIRK